MPFSKMAPALLRAAQQAPFDVLLARHGAGLTTLAEVADVPTLLVRLDAARPYSAERDALLADLLRLHRRSRDGAALSALLYALHAGVVGRCWRLATKGRELREGAAELFAALVTCLDAFDPDARTPHVQAGVGWAVENRLRRQRKAERRQRKALERVVRIAESAGADLDAGVHGLDLVIELRNARPANDRHIELDAADMEAARALEARLVEQGLLRPRDAALVCLVDVHGRPVAEAASSLGLHLEAARKALQRARRHLRSQRRAVESLFVSPSSVRRGLSE